MAIRNAVLVCSSLLLACAFQSALAFNESLSFRASANGGFVAVVSGMSDGPDCSPEFHAPSSVVVSGTSIAISSEDEVRGCFIPLSPRPYQVVAELGPLAGASYDVVWTQSGMTLSGVLVPSGVEGGAAPVALPTLSRSWIFLLVLGLLATSARLLRRQSRPRRSSAD